MATTDIAIYRQSAGAQRPPTHVPAVSAEIIFPENCALPRKPAAAEIREQPAAEMAKLRLLMVEDDEADVELNLRALRSGGFEAVADVVQSAEGLLERIRTTTYDLILTDYNLPSWTGMEALELVRQEGLEIPVILVTGALGDVKAVECIKRGAADYILKDHLARLPESVRRALREKNLREEHRKAQQELARSNRDLEQFAYVASHDLQEPLRMVATYTQLLAERYQGKLDESADKYIHYAVDGALRMQRLVHDLLAFSRVGQQREEIVFVDCNQLLKIALKNLHAAIQESGARITWERLPEVEGHRSQLTQVFQNLIGNAIKFRGCEPPAIRVCAVLSGKEWLFSISDNGIGIAPECLGSVFEIFKRLHTRSEYPGNGIGLAICKKIIEQHGGRIWVESEPGCGSTFKFTLPLAAERGELRSC